MKFGKTDPLSRVKRDSTDRAVSPVIGVILMVAITVILAAVSGVFVLGLADDLGESPTQATLSFDSDGDSNLTIAHDGGDTLDFDEGDYVIVLDGTTEDYDLSKNDSLASGESFTIDIDEESFDFEGDDDPVDVSIRDNNAGSTVDSGSVVLELEER